MTEGALYPILHKLEANLLLDSYSKIEDNRVRKYYKLTEKGSSEMETYLHAMKEYLDTMTSLIFSPKIT
jgi:DNA-binding PadR family transcriptional regulator